MAALKPTRVYLDREQEHALQRRAKANGTNLSDELRRAIDWYLTGVTIPGEFRLLDDGARRFEVDVRRMAREIDLINARLDAALARLSRRRQRTPRRVH
jgi:hypothetical protein